MINKKKKQFLKLPVLEGGNHDFKKFIEDNLQYPEEALKKNIEGIVHLSYNVDDYGNVLNAKIDKDLGFGCDEEALRLINMLKFSKVKNRRVRVKISQKAKIIFNLKKLKIKSSTINYTVVKNDDTNKKNDIKYSYSININKI